MKRRRHQRPKGRLHGHATLRRRIKVRPGTDRAPGRSSVQKPQTEEAYLKRLRELQGQNEVLRQRIEIEAHTFSSAIEDFLARLETLRQNLNDLPRPLGQVATEERRQYIG
jgi:hypothetical protein